MAFVTTTLVGSSKVLLLFSKSMSFVFEACCSVFLLFLFFSFPSGPSHAAGVSYLLVRSFGSLFYYYFYFYLLRAFHCFP